MSLRRSMCGGPPLLRPLQQHCCCLKFHDDQSRNDAALGNGKSDNAKKNDNKNNVSNAWGSVSGSKDCRALLYVQKPFVF